MDRPIRSGIVKFGTNTLSYHALRRGGPDDGCAACNRNLPVEPDMEAHQVPSDMRCKTKACQKLFAEADSGLPVSERLAIPTRARIIPKPQRPHKPTQLQQGILYAAADLARYIVQVEDVAALLRRQGLADADCSDIDEMDKEQLRVLRDDFGLPLRGLD
ncbi:hypothetical protein ACEN2T_17895 [Pseudomonas sp. W22_MBD1_FP4]|uniref:hypothetical protein n=1 Tax=Pseudomonas sp. W22_MBD1_FP4 TaxID=3240272 RepID=UPI003F990FB6